MAFLCLSGAAAVALVMDYSGSMDDDDVANAEQSVRAFIGRMTDADVGKLVKFSSDVHPHPPDRFTGKAELLDLLETGRDGRGGNTALYAAMLSGIADLGSQASGFDRALIAFTDGRNNKNPDGQAAVDRIIADAKAGGITVYTIGLGDVDDDTLRQIAEGTGGKYHYVATSDQMETIYDDLGEEVFTCSESRGYLL